MIHVSIHVVPYRYVERFYSDSDSGFCVSYIHLSRLQNDIFKAHFIGLVKTLYPGVQLLGSMAKNTSESCEISPYVTLKEKSPCPIFSLVCVYSSRITPVFAHGDTADCQVTLNRLPLLINPYAII